MFTNRFRSVDERFSFGKKKLKTSTSIIEIISDFVVSLSHDEHESWERVDCNFSLLYTGLHMRRLKRLPLHKYTEYV